MLVGIIGRADGEDVRVIASRVKRAVISGRGDHDSSLILEVLSSGLYRRTAGDNEADVSDPRAVICGPVQAAGDGGIGGRPAGVRNANRHESAIPGNRSYAHRIVT